MGVLEDAEFLLESAAALEPTNTGVRIDYINALRKRQKYAKALVQAQNLTDSAPENLQFQSIFAVECMQSGDFEKAIERFDTILKKLPGDPVTLTSKGHALKTKGASEEAVSSYRDAIQSHRAHGEAYYSLANLKTYNFDDNEILSMRELVKDRNLSFMDRVYLNFSLGKALEDREDYRGSFKHYEQGNLLKKTQSRYDAGQMGLELKAQKEFLNGSFFSDHKNVGYAAGRAGKIGYSNGNEKFQLRIENKNFGLKKIRYWKHGNKMIYIVPISNGRVVTLYGNLSASSAIEIANSIN